MNHQTLAKEQHKYKPLALLAIIGLTQHFCSVTVHWNQIYDLLSASIPGVGVADKDDDVLMATDCSTIEDGCGSME